ncbi:hypothetical protein BDF19DRAFT_426486 [Syncephalis fuscata]|nr:hypothetical protein BDF19DRAFT_426486 [Syncephalis fuscata]
MLSLFALKRGQYLVWLGKRAVALARAAVRFWDLCVALCLFLLLEQRLQRGFTGHCHVGRRSLEFVLRRIGFSGILDHVHGVSMDCQP